ncbi:hypothetical protein L1987_10960 [Smallanthus sonchifolius]|uniref:Uncharacterized protein n=1 Tax=Smallanthus sonchifolius TaxID=185202 RepID=A0ACB9JBT7_9ASTR|nr:hypothetical protein L1987_10960 [Smallanthus sonchifolius]
MTQHGLWAVGFDKLTCHYFLLVLISGKLGLPLDSVEYQVAFPLCGAEQTRSPSNRTDTKCKTHSSPPVRYVDSLR